jgi:class 3 adenylate cyclase/tetratricopeptide (TPR) repeat protein
VATTGQRTSCSGCGAANRPGRKFCAECGIPLGVTCANCGATNEPGELFCGECGTRIDDAVTPVPAPSVAVERRLVSVLFADLVGFTPLSEDRDAEEVRDLLSRYFEIAAGVIGRYGGQVEKFIGDAVMAVWGTPVAQEDDAERAVRAALELMGAVSEFGREASMPELAARAGVLTGEAAVNLGAAGQGMVAGDLVNAASRVQAAADPGNVLVGDTTRRATEAAVAYADAGAHELKGKAEPMQLWRALRVTAGRAGGMKSEGLEPPFVGRDREFRLIKELLHASADEGKAHLVSVAGIAGIGKSRLSWELYKYIDGITQRIAWHRGRCLAYGDGVTYWALAEMVRMRAEIAEGEDAEEARPKLDAALEAAVADAEERAWIRPRLGQLLSLDATEDHDQADLFAGWRLFFERIAERNPVVLVFEDMQWADAPLLAFIEYLLEWSRSHAILVLALARPELAERHAQWAGSLRNATTLSLEPLAPDAMEALLDGFVPGLPDDLRTQILERSQGVPLYAVETVRMLLDRGLLEQVGDEYRPSGTIEALEVPETLQALVTARLDGLPADERAVLQDACVLGKTFTPAGLAALSESGTEELDRLLHALVRKEVLALQSDPRSPERGQYSFLQDLLRQVAYEALPRRERKRRHLAAAEHLEREWRDGDQVDVVEIVAAHYLAANALDPSADDATTIREKAHSMLVQAGERAAGLGATESARGYFEQALELSDSPLRAAELHERAGQMAVNEGQPENARPHFEQAIAAFAELGLTHPAARVTARLAIVTWHFEGDIERAIADMEQSLSVLGGEEPDADLGMLTAQLARALYFAGRIDEAMERNELALDIAEALELPEVLSHALNTKSVILHFARGRRQEAMVLMKHALQVALEHDRTEAALRAFNNLTSYYAYACRTREALANVADFEAFARRVGSRRDLPQVLRWRSGLLEGLGRWDEALEISEEIAIGEGVGRGGAVQVLAIRMRRGQLDEARRGLAALEEVTDPNEIQSVSFYRTLEAGLRLAEGRPKDALVAAEIALQYRAGQGIAEVAEALERALEAAFELADDAKVDELLAIVERAPPGQLTPVLRALGARFAARRAARQGDGATAGAGFAAAAAIFQEIESPFDRAVVLLDHAEWLAAEGQLEEAEPLAAEARELFERLRATPYVERVDRLPAGAAAAR